MIIKVIALIVAMVATGASLVPAPPASQDNIGSEVTQYEQAVADYEWVKENIKYRCSYWGSVEETLASGTGHCGAKCEVLVSMLKSNDIEARYVEGRPADGTLPITWMIFSDVHFWVEAKVDGKWLTLDPTPDSGIVCLLGDTEPGTHLGSPEYITGWDELPPWYKEGYNHPLMLPPRWLSNIKLTYYRIMK